MAAAYIIGKPVRIGCDRDEQSVDQAKFDGIAMSSRGARACAMLLLPCFPLSCCCHDLDDQREEGADDGWGYCAKNCCCCCQHVGQWSGLFDVSHALEFRLVSDGSLEVNQQTVSCCCFSSWRSRSFAKSDIKLIGVFASTVEYKYVPSVVVDQEDHKCPGGGIVVPVYSQPDLLVDSNADSLYGSLPGFFDCLCDPCFNCPLRCVSTIDCCFCCCGLLFGEAPCGGSRRLKGALKTRKCAFLGADVSSAGVVRLTRLAWQPSAIKKLVEVGQKAHAAFPDLNASEAPARFTMEKDDRLSWRPPRRMFVYTRGGGGGGGDGGGG